MMLRRHREVLGALLGAALLLAAARGAADPAPTRLFFQPGSSSAYASGEVAAGGRRDYVLAVNAGLTITVALESESGGLTFSVAPAGGGAPLHTGQPGGERTWSGRAGEAGEYLISVQLGPGATPTARPARFRLAVTLS